MPRAGARPPAHRLGIASLDLPHRAMLSRASRPFVGATLLAVLGCFPDAPRLDDSGSASADGPTATLGVPPGATTTITTSASGAPGDTTDEAHDSDASGTETSAGIGETSSTAADDETTSPGDDSATASSTGELASTDDGSTGEPAASTGIDASTGNADESTGGASDPDTGSVDTGDPGIPDRDDDGIPDDLDDCPDVPDPDQSDRDGDGIGDVCDLCPDLFELAPSDRDGDGIGDRCDEEIIDDDILYVPAGATWTANGQRCYGVVHIAGTVQVSPEGTFGGRLSLRSADTILVTATGRIDATGAGSRGGAPGSAVDRGGASGEGPSPGCGGGPGTLSAQGGSGGGYGGRGGLPGTDVDDPTTCPLCSEPTLPACIGAPGEPRGTTDGIDLILGSGGGAAGNTLTCAGGSGGAGGGAIQLVAAEAIVIDGTLLADGTQPLLPDGTLCLTRPGGGGGSGGGILLAAPRLDVRSTARISATGGTGGDARGNDLLGTGLPGGGGGGGRIKLFGASTSPFIDVFDVSGGSGGTSGALIGGAGAPGAVGTGDEIPPELLEARCN